MNIKLLGFSDFLSCQIADTIMAVSLYLACVRILHYLEYFGQS